MTYRDLMHQITAFHLPRWQHVLFQRGDNTPRRLDAASIRDALNRNIPDPVADALEWGQTQLEKST